MSSLVRGTILHIQCHPLLVAGDGSMSVMIWRWDGIEAVRQEWDLFAGANSPLTSGGCHLFTDLRRVRRMAGTANGGLATIQRNDELSLPSPSPLPPGWSMSPPRRRHHSATSSRRTCPEIQNQPSSPHSVASPCPLLPSVRQSVDPCASPSHSRKASMPDTQTQHSLGPVSKVLVQTAPA